MNSETFSLVVGVFALLAAGLAAYWKGQASLSEKLFEAMAKGDRETKEELRREASERRAEVDRRLEGIEDEQEHQDNRLRMIENWKAISEGRRPPRGG